MRNHRKFFPTPAPVLLATLFLLAAAGQAAWAQDELAVAKDTLAIKADVWEISCGTRDLEQGCVPGNQLRLEIEFQVIGALPSGGQLWV
ncbi:MAG TPA: hypothetical protein VGA39_02110, partial [Candidatus Acidoferrales bacterium]